MNDILVITVFILVGVLAIWWALTPRDSEDDSSSRSWKASPLRRWLQRAGFRSSGAPLRFILATGAAMAIGGIFASIVWSSPLADVGIEYLREIPGGFGEALIPILTVAPFIAFIIPSCLPWVYVRGKRRTRVREVDEDLPMTLELLATLAQSGLGFDSALQRVLESSTQRRTLHEELDSYRLECVAGVPRQRALRRLSERVEVSSLSMVVAALVQSERVGSGFAGVLRTQATEVRASRKQKAQLQAQTLPVKLMFPLVLCFLPAIFVATLGPAFYSFFELADAVIRQSR